MADWRHRAACLEHDPELFFPDRADSETWEEPRHICRTCDVINECLKHAEITNSREGMFGGLTPKERASRHRTKVRNARQLFLAAEKAAG